MMCEIDAYSGRGLLPTFGERKRCTKRKKEWFDNEAFWRELYPFMFPEQRFTQTREQIEKVLSLTRPSGNTALDLCLGKECVARILQPATSDVLPDGTTLVRRHEIFDNWTRIRNEWILIRQGRARTFKFYHTVYSGQELKDRMAQIGFTDVKLFGNHNGDEYGANAQRLIVVGHKPDEQKANKH